MGAGGVLVPVQQELARGQVPQLEPLKGQARQGFAQVLAQWQQHRTDG